MAWLNHDALTSTNLNNKSGLVFNVKDKAYGAKGDGTTDDTAAIMAADAAACDGTLGLDGSTVLAQATVFFPPGTYRHDSTLTYRGAPWRGAGQGATFLEYHGSSGPAIDAVGTFAARKLLYLSGLTVDGQGATGTAYGLRLGHNYRCTPALDGVRVINFPGLGIYFAADAYCLSFNDVYLAFNLGGGIGLAGTITDLNAVEWYGLEIEACGTVGSGIGGAMEFTSAVQQMAFFGGVWEGNRGVAEARFTGSDVALYGVYVECNPPATGVVDGLVFAGASTAMLSGARVMGVWESTGKAVRCMGSSVVVIDRLVSNGDNWSGANLSVEDTAQVSMLSAGTGVTGVAAIAGGAKFYPPAWEGNSTLNLFSLGASTGRPVKIDTTFGKVRIKGDAGGWATEFGFRGSGDTDLGGFGATGAADALSHYFVGPTSTTSPLYVYPTGGVHVGTTAADPGAGFLGAEVGLKVGVNQVVGAQGAAVADATDAATTMARLNDLLARVRAHGLIAT